MNLLKSAKWLGVDTVKISPCIVSNDGNENDAYHAPFFDEAKALAVKTKKELEDENFEVNECYHGAEIRFCQKIRVVSDASDAPRDESRPKYLSVSG